MQKYKKHAINLFLIFHLIAIVSWCLPFDVFPLNACRNLVRPYFLWTGLFQTWDMFAPAPKRTNSYLEAAVVYPDGTTDYWVFPTMDRLSLTQRYAKERYRKFEEYLPLNQNADLWPDVARYVAQHAASASKHPDTIELIINWSELALNPDGSFAVSPWQSRVFYRYSPEPDNFQP